MALPAFNELTRPALEMVVNSDDAVHVREIRKYLIDLFDVAEINLAEVLSSGEEKFYNRVRWVAWSFKHAGLLHSPSRGMFVSTPEGEAYLLSHSGTIERKTLTAMIAQPSQDQDTTTEGDQSAPPVVVPTVVERADLEDAAPDEQMDQAFAQIREKLASDLQEAISLVSPKQFEKLVIELLAAMGYGRPEHTGKSGDGGIDGIINQDSLGLEKVYVQAKRWNDKQISPADIQQFAGSLDTFGASKGVFITASSFSGNARQTAADISKGNKIISLIDGPVLAGLMIQHNVGVFAKRTYDVKSLDENYFAEEV